MVKVKLKAKVNDGRSMNDLESFRCASLSSGSGSSSTSLSSPSNSNSRAPRRVSVLVAGGQVEASGVAWAVRNLWNDAV